MFLKGRTPIRKSPQQPLQTTLTVSDGCKSAQVLDAGITSGASCSGGRRPKSARARSRGRFGRGGSQRYGDLIFAPVMVVGAKLARGDLDRVWSGAWKRAIGISVVAWSVSTGDRFVDWRGCGRERSPPAWSQRNGTGKRRR